MSLKKIWLYPLLFAVIGSFLGMLLRYSFIGNLSGFNFRHVLHAHSHVMLMGFLFNALLILVWKNFTKGWDSLSFNLYIALQVCMAAMIVAFITQGYATFSILFSTLHLWISYILLIRLWKRLEPNIEMITLVKVGIVFHFVSSLGPYTLGPLMVLDMKDTAWYQQAIFFYLHFQFMGLFFVWMLALLFQKSKQFISNKQINLITVCLALLYAHSLDYSFNHWTIQFFGGIGSVLLFLILFSFQNSFLNQRTSIRSIYYLVLIVAIINIIGSLPQISILVKEYRFILVAWLHFLFLGLYVPFIWVFLSKKIHPNLWLLYGLAFLFSESLLVFPNLLSKMTGLSVFLLLFLAYTGVFISICLVHFNYLFRHELKNN